MKAVSADGWTAHTGTVASMADFGVFVDFGCERPGLIPFRGNQKAEEKQRLRSLLVGDPLTVYVTSRHRDSGKINLSLTPRERPRIPFRNVIADGRTPYAGRVANIAAFGAFVDIGTEMQALLPFREQPADGNAMRLQRGDEVTVYVIEKRKDTDKLVCALQPASSMRRPMRDLVADGHTPHKGIVRSLLVGAGAFVDLGFETHAVLPAKVNGSTDARVLALQPGEEVTVYVSQVLPHTGKVSVSLDPRPVPLRSWSDIVADGQTPYDGLVVGKTDFGAFVDLDCPQHGLLPVRDVPEAEAWERIQVGSRMRVYVHTKSKETGKISVSLRRSPTPRERWEAIVCDGQTPYEGRVLASNWYGVFVDIGCEVHGRILIPEGGDSRMAALRPGNCVAVYVVEKRPESGQVLLSLDRRDRPLRRVADLVVDGRTAYEGVLEALCPLGGWVDLGCERRALLPRQSFSAGGLVGAEDDDGLEVGRPVRVYIFRRNPTCGRLTVSLRPSASPRLRLADVLREPRVGQYRGWVHNIEHDFAHVDFGCEASGALPRAAAPPGLAVGDEVEVRVVGFDAEAGRVLFARARPPPPPRPAPPQLPLPPAG